MHPVYRLTIAVLIAFGYLGFRVGPAWADETVHLVQPGETVFRIALNHGVTMEALRAANRIRGNLIYAGQSLTIPASGAVQPASEQAPAAVPAVVSEPAPVAGERTHVVQPGETLFKIGLQYNLSWLDIQSANGLTGTIIYPGQKLIIRGPSAPPSGQPAASPQSMPAAPAGAHKWFLVDLSEQRLYAFEGNTQVRTTLVSTGLPSTPTVTGTFYIYLRLPSQRMRGPGYDLPNVPYVQYFYQGYGLHGTYWHNNFGTPMSHGCVNLPTEEAEWAYNWADYGTPVVVQA